jgi:LemA protein
VLLMGVGVYNGLARGRNQVKNAFQQIDVQLQRRYDLIPNLVESAKAYMKFEQTTLENVIQARNQGLAAVKAVEANVLDGNAMGRLQVAEASLSQGMGKFMAVMESYPDLKSNSTMKSLMEELSSTENRVSFARQAFNDSVMGYNNQIDSFPSNVMAGFFRFERATGLELADPKAREAVKVNFGG